MAPKVIGKKLLKEIKASRDQVNKSSHLKKPRLSSPKLKIAISSCPTPTMIMSSSKTPSSTPLVLPVDSSRNKIVGEVALDFSSTYKEEPPTPKVPLLLPSSSLVPSKLAILFSSVSCTTLHEKNSCEKEFLCLVEKMEKLQNSLLAFPREGPSGIEGEFEAFCL
ncbi:unnamed protein product [Ilex paraguariensis]|uniref:Uncharacterized protein n=1 Tax=Ilex paraguariensis TaxID=185542 RepID=A0ABC8UMU6_9AQUA